MVYIFSVMVYKFYNHDDCQGRRVFVIVKPPWRTNILHSYSYSSYLTSPYSSTSLALSTSLPYYFLLLLLLLRWTRWNINQLPSPFPPPPIPLLQDDGRIFPYLIICLTLHLLWGHKSAIVITSAGTGILPQVSMKTL